MKKPYKYAFLLAIGLTIFTLFTGGRLGATAPALTRIESPKNGGYVSGSSTVCGWAVAVSGIKTVTVSVNGKVVGITKTTIRRDDVNKTYNKGGVYKNGLYSGFTYTLNTAKFAPGTYKLTVTAVSNKGTATSTTSLFCKATPKIRVESPANGAEITKDFVLRGWSLNASGVRKVAVAIDGKAAGTAAVGISRPDINRIYNAAGSYPGAAQSGFTFTVRYAALSAGTHSVTVTSYGNDGSTVASAFSVTVTDPLPQAAIEAPTADAFFKDSVTVTGWSVSAKGVKSVQVLMDGTAVDNATVGLARPDIAKKLGTNSRYANAATSGYTYTISGLSNCKSGKHIIEIVSIGINGDSATTKTTVQKAAPLTVFDSKSVTANNADFTLTGFAVNASGVSEVSFYYGTTLLGTATPNLASADIAAGFDADGSKYSNAAQSRFSYTVSINAVPYGKGTITAKATGADGETAVGTISVDVVKPAPLGGITTPTNGQNFTTNDVSIVISGWTLNASGIKSVSVYLDSTQITDLATGLASDSTVIGKAGGDYLESDTAGFSTGNVDITGLSFAKHTIKVVAVGNDGGVYTFTSSFIKSGTSYTKYNISIATMAKKNNVDVSLIDPDKVKSADAAGIYEFMTLRYVDGITAAQLNTMLQNAGSLKGKGQAFLDAGKAYNINPVYLVAHARVESGNGTSKLSVGVKVAAGAYTFGGKSKQIAAGTYYNQFGIQAVDTNPVGQGSQYAAFCGWNSVEASIKGGAQWIASLYVWGGSPNQDTIYKMRFDPGYWDGSYKHCYEYATAKTWAHSIATIISQYSNIFNGKQIAFDIPQYNG